jgi:hypothetical protein
LDNTRPREVHWGQGELVEWLAGGESERRCKVPAAAVMAGWRLGGARRGNRTALK